MANPTQKASDYKLSRTHALHEIQKYQKWPQEALDPEMDFSNAE